MARRIPLPQTAEESKTFVKALKAGTNGDLWIGTYDRGAMVYYPGDEVFKSVSGVNPDVKTFARNGNGDMLIGTDKGVYLCPNGSLVARYYEEVNRALKDLVIQTLLFDSQGKLWVGTFGKGIHVFNPDISPAGHIEKRSGLPSNAVTCISEDSKGRIWIGTREGLVVVPDLSKPESLKNVTGNDRRDSIHIASLETDADCNVWASTNAGILRIGPDYDCVMAYPFRSSSGSLPLHTFMDNASAKDNDGRIFFASGNGIFEVEPKTLLATTDAMPVFVTGFEVIKDRHSRENKYSLPVASKKIVLPYDDNTFNISFNILDHALANSTEFAYKMDGDDNVWIYPAGNIALYRNLPPGTYKFMVRQRRNGQEWSDPQTILTIDIRPPFWLTWWAKSLYVIIILALMYAGIVFWNNRMKLKQQILTLEEKSRDRQKLNEERLKFYTNITHELRTPLTLILGPLEDMVSDPGMPPQYSSRLNMIRNSSTNLLNLINSILEFRQTETQNRLLRVGEGNLGNLVREIGLNYKELNSNPDVEIILDICDDGTDMLFDASIVSTIVNNLMTNALKYTASGYVRLSCQSVGDNGSEWAEIKVADTGYGISPEGLEHIFERYYQVNDSHQASGTGIGLALVKSLVELHEAEIDVLSAPGKGSVFTVRLRKGNSYPGALRGNDGGALRNDNGLPRPDNRVSSRPKVLVVEDNHDLRSYISKVLERDFDVICAKNGLEGLESVHSDNPDIIITDIMMPEMDGITMCRQIKDDIVTSHIPVIMLTAKDSSADKQEGYEAGAASYLTKPFSAKLLLARVNNIMRLQRKLAEHLREQANRQFPQNAGADSNGQNESGEPQQKIGEAEKNQILSPLDRQFVDKIISIINDNIANPDLGVAFLADKMCMSNSTLYRKVIAILGMSTNEYVRGIRMERAREMLVQGLYPITEVAYRCGFSSHSSFAKSFKKHFGMSASEYVSAVKERPGGKAADPPAFS